MKVLKKATIVQKAKTTEHTMTERQVLESVRSCPFLVTLHWAFQTESKLHLVMGMSRSRYRRLFLIFKVSFTFIRACYDHSQLVLVVYKLRIPSYLRYNKLVK